MAEWNDLAVLQERVRRVLHAREETVMPLLTREMAEIIRYLGELKLLREDNESLLSEVNWYRKQYGPSPEPIDHINITVEIIDDKERIRDGS